MNPNSQTVGILCGLASEAALARCVAGARVALTAARPERAKQEARRLIAEGATALISFGLAGGLRPDLAAGSLILGTEVHAGNIQKACDPTWRAALRQTFPYAHVGPVWSSPRIVACAADKRDLYTRTSCLAVDMESEAVATCATEAKIPFAVLRVVVDTADMDLPFAAQVPLRADGTLDGRHVLFESLRHPTDWPALLHLGRNMHVAMRALKHVVACSFKP